MRKTYYVNIWVTLRCNFRCRYCYVHSMYDNQDLTIELADKILNYIKLNKKPEQQLVIDFHGGEPLLNFEVIKYFVNQCNKTFEDVSYGMTTNGSLITQEVIKFLEVNNIDLSISLDGKESTHNFNRRSLDSSINYDTIIKNAKQLLKINANTRIRMTYDRHNINSLYDNIVYFIKQGFKVIVPVADYYSNEWKDEDYSIVLEEFKKVRKYVLDNKCKDIKMEILDNSFHCLSLCDAGTNHYNIDVNGIMYPCIFSVGKEEHIIGDIERGMDANKLKKIKQVINKRVPDCEGCALYDCCISTRCILGNYATTGDYVKPNTVECNMTNIKFNIIKEYLQDESIK
ncbi:radical SAM protein [Clostridiaceae bacterium M8S5]|nr:radical SAM protein [Clostridiaceae bacterium M8S5]